MTPVDVIALPVHPGLADEARLAREVRRSRAALARYCAAELREQASVSVWVARRHLSYRRWLLDEARQTFGAAVPSDTPVSPPMRGVA